MQSEGGVGALVICGTTGEAPTLEDGEHLDAIEFAADYVKKSGYDIKIIAGTGSNNTDHAVMMSREAEIRGADGLLWVTPYYNKTTQRGLLHHYETLAGATDLPAIIYNVPSRTGVDIVPDTAEALSKSRTSSRSKRRRATLRARSRSSRVAATSFMCIPAMTTLSCR